MGYRQEIYKDGKCISIHDDRLLEEEKVLKIAEVKSYASKLLLEDDWYIIRAAEGGKDVPLDILTRRDRIRKASGCAETAINNCDTFIKFDQCQWIVLFKEQ